MINLSEHVDTIWASPSQEFLAIVRVQSQIISLHDYVIKMVSLCLSHSLTHSPLPLCVCSSFYVVVCWCVALCCSASCRTLISLCDTRVTVLRPNLRNLSAGESWSEHVDKSPCQKMPIKKLSQKSRNSCSAVSSGIAVIMAWRREFLRLPYREIHTIAQILNDLPLNIRLVLGTLGHKCCRLSHTREYGSWLQAALLDSFISVNIHKNKYFKNHPSWQIDTVGPLDTTRPSYLRHQGCYWSVV